MTSENPNRMNVFVYSISLIPIIFTILTTISLTSNKPDCMPFYHWLLILINLCIALVSVAGMTGAYFEKNGLLRSYTIVTPFIIFALLGAFITPFVIIPKGSGRPMLNRVYRDYYLQDYSGWLKNQVVSDNNWSKIRSHIHDSEVCDKTRRLIGGYPETAYMYYFRKLNPIESGCCKPPTECEYNYVNETVWKPVNQTVWNLNTTLPSNLDCIRWSNDQERLCYDCDSCKAGVLGRLKNRLWKATITYNLPALIILTIAYIVAYVYLKFTHDDDLDGTYYKDGNFFTRLIDRIKDFF